MCVTCELIAGHDDVHPLHFYGVDVDQAISPGDFDPRHHLGVDDLVDMGLQQHDAIASICDAGGDGAATEQTQEEQYFNGCEDDPEHMVLEQFPRVYDHAHELEDIRRNSPAGASFRLV